MWWCHWENKASLLASQLGITIPAPPRVMATSASDRGWIYLHLADGMGGGVSPGFLHLIPFNLLVSVWRNSLQRRKKEDKCQRIQTGARVVFHGAIYLAFD